MLSHIATAHGCSHAAAATKHGRNELIIAAAGDNVDAGNQTHDFIFHYYCGDCCFSPIVVLLSIMPE
jgi:hypothetical protein